MNKREQPLQTRAALLNVVTLPEACHRWRKGRKTVEMAIAKGQIAARQSGRTWLIATASLITRWGPPGPPIDEG